jgi:hypothetical protein
MRYWTRSRSNKPSNQAEVGEEDHSSVETMVDEVIEVEEEAPGEQEVGAEGVELEH